MIPSYLKGNSVESPFWDLSLLCTVCTVFSFFLGYFLGYHVGKGY